MPFISSAKNPGAGPVTASILKQSHDAQLQNFRRQSSNDAARSSGNASSSGFLASLSPGLGSYLRTNSPSINLSTNFAFTTTFSPQINGRKQAKVSDFFPQTSSCGNKVSGPLNKFVEFFQNAFSEGSGKTSRIVEIDESEDTDKRTDEDRAEDLLDEEALKSFLKLNESQRKNITGIFIPKSSGFTSSSNLSAIMEAAGIWTALLSQNSSMMSIYSADCVSRMGTAPLVINVSASASPLDGSQATNSTANLFSSSSEIVVSLEFTSSASDPQQILDQPTQSSILSDHLAPVTPKSRSPGIPSEGSSGTIENSPSANSGDLKRGMFFNQIQQNPSMTLTPTRLDETFTHFMIIRDSAAPDGDNFGYMSSNDEDSSNEWKRQAMDIQSDEESSCSSMSSDESTQRFDILKARRKCRRAPRKPSEAAQIDHELSCDAKSSHCSPEPYTSPESKGFRKKISRKAKATTHTISAWIDSMKKDADLWSLFELENIPLCQTFRQEYLADADHALFCNEQPKFLHPLYQEFSLMLANLDNEAFEEPAKKERMVRFENRSPLVISSTSSLMLSEDESSSQVPHRSILKGAVYVSSIFVRSKKFKHDLGEIQKKSLRDQMSSKAETCQKKLSVFKSELNCENGSEMIESCVDCFDFVGRMIATPLQTQMIDYVAQLVDLRQHTMRAFDTLKGMGHQFAGFMEFLANSHNSSSELLEAKHRLEQLYMPLVQSASTLDDILHATNVLDDGQYEYIESMSRDAESALHARVKCLKNYHEFWMMTVGSDEDAAAEMDRVTHLEEFLSASTFLSDNSNLFNTDVLMGAIRDLKLSLSKVRSIEKQFELVYGILMEKIYRMQLTHEDFSPIDRQVYVRADSLLTSLCDPFI